ncbi:MAG: DUF3172 domain-containing protein [Elainellaceae cyanobacterium]
MKRRPKSLPRRSSNYDDRYGNDRYDDDRYDDAPRNSGGGSSGGSKSSGRSLLSSATLAILGAVLIVGIGLGAFFGSSANFSDESVASRVVIEESVANPEMCAQYGAGAIAVDLRAFVTLSPFKVFISQPLMQPGCVLRSNNWAVLESRGLLDSQQARECKNRMNTFGFIGDIDESSSDPKIDCVYENDSARNLFLKTGAGNRTQPESNRF